MGNCKPGVGQEKRGPGHKESSSEGLETTTTQKVLIEFGTPYYMKIDIEGADIAVPWLGYFIQGKGHNTFR